MERRRIRYFQFPRHKEDAPVADALSHEVFDAMFFDLPSENGWRRLGLERLFHYIRSDDTVVVDTMASLACSTEELCSITRALIDKQVDVEFFNENLIFRHSPGEPAASLFSVLERIVEFERTLTRDRQSAGIACAKLRGAYRGRKKKLSDSQVVNLQDRANAGESKSSLARDFEISRQTLYRYLRPR